MLGRAFGGLIAAFVLACGAEAGVSDYFGNWTNTEKESGGLLSGPAQGVSLARIVATPAGANAVRLHLYGRCSPECDWGSVVAHNRSDAPDSDALHTLIADFSTADAARRLTLRLGPGNTLHFDLDTAFTDHSGRHDFETAGSLHLLPAAIAAAPTPPLAAAGAAVIAKAPAPMAQAPDIAEDCERINPATVFMAPGNTGGWVVRDYNHIIVDFGSDKVAAAKAARVLAYYRIDEQCYIARPKAKMLYWRSAGQLPRDPMPGQDCEALHPDAITVRNGKVLDGDRLLIDYEADTASALRAAAVIKSYRLARQCYVARPSQKMIYWLAQ